MSSVLQTNVFALKAVSAVKGIQRDLAASTRLLSSGERSSGAADDYASLSLIQSTKSQTIGLKRASQNLTDGIGLLETAESTLDSISQALHQMRQLAVQASGSVHTQNQRASLQKEFTQLASEIDRMAEGASWNNSSLLSDPSNELVTSTVSRNSGVTELEGDPLTMLFNGTDGVAVVTDAGLTSAMSSNKWTVNFQIFPTLSTTREQAFLRVEGGITSGINALDSGSGLIFFNAGGGQIFQESSASLIPNQWNGVTFSRNDQALTVSVNGAARISATGVSFPSTVASVSVGGMVGNNRYAFGGQLSSITYSSSAVADTIEIGAGENLGQKISINGRPVKSLFGLAPSLKVSDALSSSALASVALSAIDGALLSLSTQRGALGAEINRLTYAANSVDSATGLAIASRSLHSDTDYAVEASNQARASIANQVSTAVLAQANVAPKTVLALLQSLPTHRQP